MKPGALKNRKMNYRKKTFSERPFFLILYPAMGRVTDKEALSLKTEDVIMCCVNTDLAHLRGRWQMSMEQWWCPDWQGKTNGRKRYMFRCYILHQEPHMNSPGMEPDAQFFLLYLTVLTLYSPVVTICTIHFNIPKLYILFPQTALTGWAL
jgi:hypothetical protein